MQSDLTISGSHLKAVIHAIFAEGNPIIEEAYSVPEEDVRRFDTESGLLDDIDRSFSGKVRWAYYMIYYPEAKGLVRKKRNDLLPEKNGGKRFRFTVEGWGLIQLQLSGVDDQKVKCRVAVNSEKRALTWFATYPDHGDPRLWDWKLVERHARRIIRVMKKADPVGTDNDRAAPSRV
jgi:hypothetical protein